jgi:hypothetical protein
MKKGCNAKQPSGIACTDLAQLDRAGAPGHPVDFESAAGWYARACELKEKDACRQAPAMLIGYLLDQGPKPWRQGAVIDRVATIARAQLAEGNLDDAGGLHNALGVAALLKNDAAAAKKELRVAFDALPASEQAGSDAAGILLAQGIAADQLGRKGEARADYEEFLKALGPDLIGGLYTGLNITPTGGIVYAKSRIAILSRQ